MPTNDSGLSTSYLRLLEQAAEAVDIPVIGSLNGATLGSWADFARQMQDAGAAAVELNIFLVPGDVMADGAVIEQRHLDIVQLVKCSVTIPVAVKLSPYFSSFGSMALRLDAGGADGLVLFNRWIQPKIDVEAIAVDSGLELSTPTEARLAQTWIAALHGRVRASLAGTTGVETADDVVRYLLAGADVVMSTSALVRHGEDYAGLDVYKRQGHWPLMRYNPILRAQGRNPFLLDSPRPRITLQDYHKNELRFRMLAGADPAEAARLLELGQEQVARRWSEYEELATREAQDFAADARKES